MVDNLLQHREISRRVEQYTSLNQWLAQARVPDYMPAAFPLIN